MEKRQPESINPVHTCTLNDTLGSLLATIKSQLVFRFVVVETAVVSDVPNNVVANSDPTTTASSTTHSESNNPSSSSLDDEDEEDIQVFVKKRKPLDQQSVTSDTSAIIEGRLLGVISHSDLLSYLIKSSG